MRLRFSADRLRETIPRYRPGVLCCNGLRPAPKFLRPKKATVGPREETIGVTRLFVAPSTSGLAARTWNPNVWKDLAIAVNRR